MKGRLLFLILALVAMGYALRWERHKVAPLDDGPVKSLSGPQFVKGITTDDFGRWTAQVYDLTSLSPLSASERDCKT